MHLLRSDTASAVVLVRALVGFRPVTGGVLPYAAALLLLVGAGLWRIPSARQR